MSDPRRSALLAGVLCGLAANFLWGTAFLALVAAALPVLALAGGDAVIPRARFGADTAGALLPLIAGGAALGVVVSWGGTTLWNQASERLPVSLAGQLIVFETISGLTYVFIAESRTPPALELLGITALLGGVLLGIHRMAPASAEPSATA